MMAQMISKDSSARLKQIGHDMAKDRQPITAAFKRAKAVTPAQQEKVMSAWWEFWRNHHKGTK